MAALFSSGRTKYSTLRSYKSGENKNTRIPEGMWEKCKKCHGTVYAKQLEENLYTCPRCNYHNPVSAPKRVEMLTDKDSFQEIDQNMESVDALGFDGMISYVEKLESNKKKTGMKEAVCCGTATLDGRKYALAIMDFRFLGGSMGSVVGEKITRITEQATKEKVPLVIISASGGARMYEGVLSLMQMAKTSAALKRHANAGLSFISILTQPTYGGTTASFASLGDLTLAEPGAMIGFAGPRVIRDTAQAKLPENFQTAEFLLEKGMIDRIIDRKNLRQELSLCLEYLTSGCSV